FSDKGATVPSEFFRSGESIGYGSRGHGTVPGGPRTDQDLCGEFYPATHFHVTHALGFLNQLLPAPVKTRTKHAPAIGYPLSPDPQRGLEREAPDSCHPGRFSQR